jgi:hypothetical protein
LPSAPRTRGTRTSIFTSMRTTRGARRKSLTTPRTGSRRLTTGPMGQSETTSTVIQSMSGTSSRARSWTTNLISTTTEGDGMIQRLGGSSVQTRSCRSR